MNTNVNRFSQQRKKPVIGHSKADSLGFFNLLASGGLIDKVEELFQSIESDCFRQHTRCRCFRASDERFRSCLPIVIKLLANGWLRACPPCYVSMDDVIAIAQAKPTRSAD